MNPATETEARQLLQACERLPYGAERRRMAANAMDLADAQEDERFRYLVRMAYLRNAYGAPNDETEFAVFAWCLAMHDSDPANFPESIQYDSLLWYYKHIIALALDTPSVPLAQLDGLLEDFERRCSLTGNGSKAAAMLRAKREIDVAGPDAVVAPFARYLALPRDLLSDCAGCDAQSEATLQIELGDDRAALRTGEVVLAGVFPCSEQPHRMQATLLLPLLRAGRDQDAIDTHLAAYLLNQQAGSVESSAARHLEFLTVTGNFTRALEVVDRFVPMLDAGLDRIEGLALLRAARYLCLHLEETGVSDSVVTLPSSVTGVPSAAFTPAAAATELDRMGIALAQRFDERNGNDRRVSWFRDTSDLEAVVRDLPIGAK